MRMRRGSFAGIGIEGGLHLFEPILAGDASEDIGALVRSVGIAKRLAQPLLNPAPGVLPFRENDEPTIIRRGGARARLRPCMARS